MIKSALIFFGLLFASSTFAVASDWSTTAHVTKIEATYVPDFIYFWADSGSNSCPAGITLRWNAAGSTADARASNTQAELSVLMIALTSGKKVQILGYNPSASTECTIQYIYLLSSQ